MKKNILPPIDFFLRFAHRVRKTARQHLRVICDNYKNNASYSSYRTTVIIIIIMHCIIFPVDPRTKDWFLMHNPLPTALICATYVFTVKVAGPRFMANRKPMELRNILIAYNLFQVIFSSWLFYEVSADIIVPCRINKYNIIKTTTTGLALEPFLRRSNSML